MTFVKGLEKTMGMVEAFARVLQQSQCATGLNSTSWCEDNPVAERNVGWQESSWRPGSWEFDNKWYQQNAEDELADGAGGGLAGK
jgi:hypothetical protein